MSLDDLFEEMYLWDLIQDMREWESYLKDVFCSAAYVDSLGKDVSCPAMDEESPGKDTRAAERRSARNMALCKREHYRKQQARRAEPRRNTAWQRRPCRSYTRSCLILDVYVHA
jgi:hypothetical protein